MIEDPSQIVITPGDPGPSMPWYVDDALASSTIQMMTLEEECCYRRLLDFQWKDGKISRNFEKIRELCKRPPRKRFEKIWAVVSVCFVLLTDGSGYVNLRMHAIREERLAFKSERSKSGKLGMEHRWKDHNSANNSAITQPITKNNSPSPSPSPSKKANTVDSSLTLVGSAARKSRAPAELPITDSMRAWAEENGIAVNLEAETTHMLDHFRGKGESRQDWIATWRTWMRNSKRFGTHSPSGNRKGSGGKPKLPEYNHDELEEARQRMFGDKYKGSV